MYKIPFNSLYIVYRMWLMVRSLSPLTEYTYCVTFPLINCILLGLFILSYSILAIPLFASDTRALHVPFK